ncbi:MAG: Rrf2 family transcriptional regulator [Clostridiaceae bacterium]|nr:Rrf2 family transcriptional regulator [Clostridiaceae bacterium]
MKISTKGRYGLRAMMDLAAYSNGGHVALNSIAKRQTISINYLEQVFSVLRNAGLVKSIKGAQGGYILTKKPSEIRIGTILRALEGDLSVVDYKDTENKNAIGICVKEMVWDKMDKCLNEVVDSITLADLADDCRKMNGTEHTMYYI